MHKNEKTFSVGKKVYIFIIIIVLSAVFGTALISYFINANQIDTYYKRNASDSAKNFASTVDIVYLEELSQAIVSDEYQALRDEAEATDNEQLIEDYLKEHGLWDKYIKTQHDIDNYLNNIRDIKYLYIVVWGGTDGLYDMYLLDDSRNPIYETGYFEKRETEFLGVDASNGVAPTISNGDWGWLCSAYAPVYNADGEFICLVGCDIGMGDVMKQRENYLLYIIISALVFMAAVLVLAVIFINRTVINPLNLLTEEMKKFKPSENTSYENAGVINLEIKSRDEICDLYNGIRSMQINIIDYLNDLTTLQKDKERAENDIKVRDEKIGQISKEAYRDVLTGVGSKAAYVRKIEEINTKISEENIEFAVVMVDMNNLKQINDEYGHKAGDRYIKGCCHVICEVFKHSPVFRIGGDEFVVILHGQDYENRYKCIDEIRAEYEKSYNSNTSEPWKKYSASVGMAENASDDNTFELVFKRADNAMYEAKKEFKKEHGSYR